MRGSDTAAVAAALLALGTAPHLPARADGFDLAVPAASVPAVPTRVDEAGIGGFLGAWARSAAAARATQPGWSSPVVTTTGLLEQRVRFDVQQQNAKGGQQTTGFDGGRGVDLIVGPTTEIQIAPPPYLTRTAPDGKGDVSGLADWPFLRLEQRLASSPAGAGNYVLTAWVTVQAPTGIAPFSGDAWTVLPTLAFGKGWGDFDVQGTVSATLPASRAGVLGHPMQTNVAFQYNLWKLLWPELEVSWTYYPDGARGGRNTVYLAPGLVVGKIPLANDLYATFGAAYQAAVTPNFAAGPRTPGYQNAVLFTSRLTF